ncbi:hypothetical protein Droror1_Dr00023313, partial [Drosera rotundifolia]
MAYIENETIQHEWWTESVGYATGAQAAMQKGIHEVAAREQLPKQPSASPMIVMMEEFLRIRRKVEEPAKPDSKMYFQRLNAYRPKRFTGDDDPTILENWFRDMENLYKAVGCPEKLKVSFGIYYLEGEANNWRTTVAEQAELSNFDWEQLKERIRDRYYPESLRNQMGEEFSSLEQ